MASKSSAVADDTEPLAVLFVLHDKFDLLDFAGPAEALAYAKHDLNDPETKAFDITVAGAESNVFSEQGIAVSSQISFKEAHERLEEFDILAVVGGGTSAIIKAKAEPYGLITAFAELQKANPIRERTLLAVCSGALFLADLGLLAGLSATTHPSVLTTFENLCSQAATRELDERTDVLDDARYVVNNLRFDLGNEDENPYIRRKSDARRPSNARKGSISLKGSNSRRESIVRRAAMRLGGLRVITTGGVSAGIDAALYLVGALVSDQAAVDVARILQWTWVKGVVVDGLDV